VRSVSCSVVEIGMVRKIDTVHLLIMREVIMHNSDIAKLLASPTIICIMSKCTVLFEPGSALSTRTHYIRMFDDISPR